MADLGMDFNADEVAPSSGFEPMPVGDYEVQIVEADVAPAKSGKGTVLSYKAEVISPAEFTGRTVFERLNIRHDNPVAQKIGQEQLSALCRATGVRQVTNTDQLLYQPFWANLGVENYKASNGDDRSRNIVKKYHFEEDTAPPVDKPAPTPPAAQNANRPGAPAAGARPGLPWKKPA
ncbi:hypothetical protein PMNALOAF_2705 [Methylobacterium adhaesivum]|uniref:DUF669 domain-containing protein n=1 Tax=Methylobacterium adhaesivum TaxID=333297 RepID=A0ABT8BLJ9_9HYPH|nr:DUF669 domain-containing protein [Methylobacterium adhaesivum]MDN3592059.1 DUF669 domain-containing protein [Methylobacterium adhaesivum]GJD31446.1 hypothetical protein PMNALOAF_2705 [Methylobacterium adhaesivum]